MSYASSLYELASEGPGLLYKKPAPLSFCADGDYDLLSSQVEGHRRFWNTGNVKSIWRLTYPDANPNLTNIHPDVVKVDWVFIIGYVLSLIALLFTYDTISGEHEQGTLRLILANPIPRHTVLMGKFLGVFLSVHIPFALAVLTNLLVITTSSQMQLGSTEWGRLGILCFIAVLYTCLFIALGLLVSASVRESPMSLVSLLLIWVNVVIFIPNTLAATINDSSLPMTSNEVKERRKELMNNFRKSSQGWTKKWPERANSPTISTMWWSKHIIKDAQQNEYLNEEYLIQQNSQVSRARTITRISPAAILQHLFESLAGTGFQRHLQFLENARRYARQYREFIIDTDRSDLESPHLIGIREGMSGKSVNSQAIPFFKDTLSLSQDFNNTSTEFLILVLFFFVLLLGAYFSFVRGDIG